MLTSLHSVDNAKKKSPLAIRVSYSREFMLTTNSRKMKMKWKLMPHSHLLRYMQKIKDIAVYSRRIVVKEFIEETGISCVTTFPFALKRVEDLLADFLTVLKKNLYRSAAFFNFFLSANLKFENVPVTFWSSSLHKKSPISYSRFSRVRSVSIRLEFGNKILC